MPTYEYECLPNKHRFEVKQSFTDDALTACQVCGEPVRKVFSAAGIVFKGSGYYVTDSRASANGKAKEKASDSGSSEGSEAGSSTSESSEKAPAAKSSDAKSAGSSTKATSGDSTASQPD